MPNLYYTAPPDEAFEEMKKACIEVWNQYYDSCDYLIARIRRRGNVRNNFMFLFEMFCDVSDKQKVVQKLSKRTKNELRARLVDGGNSPVQIAMMGL